MNYGILMLLLVCRNDNSNCSSKKQADQDLQNQLKSPHDHYKKTENHSLGRDSQQFLLKNKFCKTEEVTMQEFNCKSLRIALGESREAYGRS
jgi:hypothetical protein